MATIAGSNRKSSNVWQRLALRVLVTDGSLIRVGIDLQEVLTFQAVNCRTRDKASALASPGRPTTLHVSR